MLVSGRRWLPGLAAFLLVAGCVPAPKPRPAAVAPPPRPAQPAPRPTPSVARAAPRFAGEAVLSAGPEIGSLDITPESAGAALAAFQLSCRALNRRVDASGLTRPGDWAGACAAAPGATADPVSFFRTRFETLLVAGGAAFATGYYEPEIEGSRTHDEGYDTPVYARPPDLVTADIPNADGTPSGKKRRGRMQDGRLVPYHDRAAIDAGALAGKGLEIAWAKDPVEFFFMQIQGSGRLHLPDGTVLRLGYDGQNGRDYVGIGRIMREHGLIGPGTQYATSMQGIMAWMRANPDQARQLMEEDKSFVFYKPLTGPGPMGAMGVPVTGHVTVAADPKFVPLGAPVWLSTDRSEATGLWVAQDTGGAIKGANRFDTFWGAGLLARLTAGGMSAHGQALILVPRGVVARLTAPDPYAGQAAPR